MQSTPSANAFPARAGEVVARFLSFDLLGSLIPVGLIWVFWAILHSMFLHSLPGWLQATLWLGVQSVIVAHFLVPSRNGHFHMDALDLDRVDWGAVAGTSLRFALITLVWSLPLGLLLGSGGHETLLSLATWTDSSIWAKLAWPAWVLSTALVASLVAPPVCALVAAWTKHSWQLLHPDLWRHLLATGSPSLRQFLVQYVGSLAALAMLSMLVLGLIAALASLLSPTLARLLLLSALGLPFAAWPILAGRLAGCFAWHHPWREDIETDGLPVEPEPAEPAQAALQQAQSKASIPSPPNNVKAWSELSVLAEKDPEQAMTKVVLQLTHNPSDSALRALQLRLLLRLERQSDALAEAPSTLLLLTQDNRAAEAAHLFHRLGKQRHGLQLSVELLEALAQQYIEDQDFREAGWCRHSAFMARKEEDQAEQALVELAELAAMQRDRAAARALYEYSLRKHPQGKLIPQVRKALEFFSFTT